MQIKKKITQTTFVDIQQQVNGLHSSVQVVTPSMPFVVDTILLQLQHRGWALAEVTHKTQTDNVHFHAKFERQSQQALADLSEDIYHALNDVDAAVTDFSAMTDELKKLIANASQMAPHNGRHADDLAFLNWLLDNHFLFLGYRAYAISPARGKKEATIQAVKGSGLGILRHPSQSLAQPKPLSEVPPNLAAFMRNDAFISISKTLEKSRVHRYADMDYVGIKAYDDAGQVCAEHRFVGLFTSQAYTSQARHVPIVSSKINEIIENLTDGSQNAYRRRALENILETFPRDELFRLPVSDLARVAEGVFKIQELPQLKVFMCPRPEERAHTVFVYLPLERMNSSVRLKIQQLLMDKLDGESLDYQVRMGDAPLVRITIKVRQRTYGYTPCSEAEIQQLVENTILGWHDELFLALTQADTLNGLALYRKYVNTFNETYVEKTSIPQAQADIAVLEDMATHKNIRFHFVPGHAHKLPELRVFRAQKPLGLSDAMPYFDKLGLQIIKENAYSLNAGDGSLVWLHQFDIEPQTGQHLDENTRPILEQALHALWCGELEADRLNSLIINAGLTIDQVVILRALVGYVHQIALRFGMHSLQQVLVNHSGIACALTELFNARFAPDMSRSESQKKQEYYKEYIVNALQNILSSDEDTMLRCIMNVILATVRTNAWQRTSSAAPLVFKLDSSKIEGLPEPKPWKEIYVYSADFEGIHLRGGSVARGGLRWSDRHSDLRTEILGLMKAQTTKNTVIVPVGAKGGFVIKTPIPTERAERMASGEKYYRQFIQSLLSITDNRQDGIVISPAQVVRYDEDDPYLVVAADKGTATFSDFANDEAQQAGFWLDDAFASGGSQGYDHKEMGITARGAWESVRQHFLLQNIDVQRQPITVIGIGDMSGDVFGNGMLCSEHIKLIAAFNHLHIFIDPNPDPATSFKERQRLFNMPYSTWADYTPDMLSAGGAIFERKAKKLSLTKEIKALLDIPHTEITPDDLIKFILKAEADLLWNGGIGTYVKASHESHAAVADRANDALRVNASELRVKCIGEGGNLGFTQPARIEYALSGGAVNTDALDNSAGVDTSDHEVNIKILLREVKEQKKLSQVQRNKLLAAMQDDIAAHVLDTNRDQNLVITLKARQGIAGTETTMRLQHALTRQGLLNPTLEFLPDEESLQDRQRRQQSYTRPELCVLLAYAKMDIYQALLASTLPDSPLLDEWLFTYFPAKLAKYKGYMQEHPLRRELVATLITNQLVNYMGPTFVNRLREETGYKTETIVAAYLLASDIHALSSKWHELIDLNTHMALTDLLPLFERLKNMVEQSTRWLVQSGNPVQDLATQRKLWTTSAGTIEKQLPRVLGRKYQKHQQQQAQRFVKQGMPPAKADIISVWPYHMYLPLLIDLSNNVERGHNVETLTKLFFSMLDRLDIMTIQHALATLSTQDNWQRLSKVNLQQSLFNTLEQIAQNILNSTPAQADAMQALHTWLCQKGTLIEQHDYHIRQLNMTDDPTLAMVSVVQAHIDILAKQ